MPLNLGLKPMVSHLKDPVVDNRANRRNDAYESSN